MDSTLELKWQYDPFAFRVRRDAVKGVVLERRRDSYDVVLDVASVIGQIGIGSPWCWRD
jgi:hypothetical protein